MKEVGKAIITAMIWIGCVILSMVNSGNNAVFGSSGGDAVMMTVFPLIIALLATFSLYAIPEMMQAINRGQAKGELPAEKSKRINQPDKMQLLLSMMDEDEKEAFKETLKRRVLEGNRRDSAFMDGELSADADMLAAMLDENDYRQTRR